jgi:hypothetical protein
MKGNSQKDVMELTMKGNGDHEEDMNRLPNQRSKYTKKQLAKVGKII